MKINQQAVGLAIATVGAAMLAAVLFVFMPEDETAPVQQPEPVVIEGAYCWAYIHPENFPICRE